MGMSQSKIYTLHGTKFSFKYKIMGKGRSIISVFQTKPGSPPTEEEKHFGRSNGYQAPPGPVRWTRCRLRKAIVAALRPLVGCATPRPEAGEARSISGRRSGRGWSHMDGMAPRAMERIRLFIGGGDIKVYRSKMTRAARGNNPTAESHQQ